MPAGDAGDFAITRLFYCLAKPTVSIALETEDKEIEGSVASATQTEPTDVRVDLSLALTYLWVIGGAGTVAGYQVRENVPSECGERSL